MNSFYYFNKILKRVNNDLRKCRILSKHKQTYINTHKHMVNTNDGKIYCIRSPNTDKIYIGSTCQRLSARMSGHRAKRNKCTSMRIIDCGDSYIELIENYPCTTKDELLAREKHWIRSDQYKNIVVNTIGNRVCPHGREHQRCVACKGACVCEHERERSKCRICGGASICQHNQRRSQCKDCRGASVCQHNRRRYQCKECSHVKCSSCDLIICKSYMKTHCKMSKHIKTLAKDMSILLERETKKMAKDHVDGLMLNTYFRSVANNIDALMKQNTTFFTCHHPPSVFVFPDY